MGLYHGYYLQLISFLSVSWDLLVFNLHAPEIHQRKYDRCVKVTTNIYANFLSSLIDGFTGEHG